MALLSWNSKYAIGNDLVDAEHQTLFGLVNAFHSSWLENKDRTTIARLLNRLVAYAETHFGHEEQIMEAAGYPALEKHRQDHEALIDTIFHLQQSYENSDRLLEIDTIRFVKSWLLDHILEDDFLLRDFLKSRFSSNAQHSRKLPMPIQNISEQQLDAAGIRLHSSKDLFPQLHQPDDAGLPMLVVENPLGRTVIALQGAHLMSFQPTGKRDMFWVSPKCVLQAGKPIRGGIPLCLPWFGPGLDPQTLHGFARLMEWSLVAAEKQAGGATRLVLELSGDATVHAAWPHAFVFQLEVIAGSELKLALTAENKSEKPAPLAFAFHSYFAVPAVAEARVAGLEGLTYIDKTDNATKKTQQGEVAIGALTDRVYLDAPARQTIKTSAGNIVIESAAKCAVVWNAWTNDKNMADVGEGNHVGYLCVERGDVADHAVTLAPGGTYQCRMTLSL